MLSVGCRSGRHADVRRLRICADPNNLPFSNVQREGFENQIAELLAGELGVSVEYTWWPQRRGFIRNTLSARACDVVVGVPSTLERVLTTRPYYRSSYVFVYRRDSPLQLTSLDDPVLRRLKIGVELIGDDGANSPPAHVLAARGMIDNVRGFMVYGDYRLPNPPARIIEAVASGEIDVALAWGPMAGYFAARSLLPLRLIPLEQLDHGSPPFAFDISMAVRREDVHLRDELETILARRHDAIAAILASYHVPLRP
jgi:mxaJ protein